MFIDHHLQFLSQLPRFPVTNLHGPRVVDGIDFKRGKEWSKVEICRLDARDHHENTTCSKRDLFFVLNIPD